MIFGGETQYCNALLLKVTFPNSGEHFLDILTTGNH